MPTYRRGTLWRSEIIEGALPLTVTVTRTIPLPALRVPERPRQNYICAERDKKRRERRYDRPDPEREKQEPSMLVGRSSRQ
jgi:hypothetical protein